MKGLAMIVVLWLGLVAGGVVLSQRHQALLPMSSDGPRDRGDVLLDVFGEFRTVMARYLWFKMDLFHEVLDDEGVPDDQQTELLPLLRMISLLDPSLTDAYDNIAWDLYKGHRKSDEALSIIDEGLSRNPNSFQLLFRKSLISYQEKDYPAALAAAQRAAALATDEFDILNSQRMVYWSAKELKDRKAMLGAVDQLIRMRPAEQRWKDEKSKIPAL